MATPSWISNMFPDLFSNGGPKPKPNGEFTEFTDQSSRTSMKSGRGSMEEKLDRGQTIYRDGAPVPGGTSKSIDDQTRNLDDRGTGQGVNFFGYGNTTKKNPLLSGKRSDELNITTNANSTGQVEIGGFTTKSTPMMDSDYGNGNVNSASENSFYRNKMDVTKYGDQYKALGNPNIIRLTLGGEATERQEVKPAINGDPLGSVPRKLPNSDTQLAGRGKGGGDAWLSKYYFDQTYGDPYSPVNIESKVAYPAQGNVASDKYITRLQNTTNESLDNISVSKLGGQLDKSSGGGKNQSSSEKNIIRTVTMSGTLPAHKGGGMVSGALQIDSGSLSNASPLLSGRSDISPELNKNFKDMVSNGLYDTPTSEGRDGSSDNLINGKLDKLPNDKQFASKISSRLGMGLDARRNAPYHPNPSKPPNIPGQDELTPNSEENSLPRSKQISYVDGVGKSTGTVSLEDSLEQFNKDYSQRLKSIGELNSQDDLKVSNDIKNLVDLKKFADDSFERRTKEGPSSGAEVKTYGQRFYDNPLHLNKRKLPNYSGVPSGENPVDNPRKDPFNIRGVLDAENHSLSAEPDFASEDFIPLYFHDLVNKKYIPFRALIQGTTDQSDSKWSSTQYLGRADEVHVYTGFTRTLSIDFQVVALSVEELHPMWQRINYMVGLTHPAKYTEHDFIVPPFVRFNLGDIYRNQPVLITSVSTSIPSEVSWELVNNEKNNGTLERNKYEYANGDIKRKDVKVARYPTSCNLQVSMIVLQKHSPETKQNHFGDSPLHSDGKGNSTFNETLSTYTETSKATPPSKDEQSSRSRGLTADTDAKSQRSADERAGALSKSSRRQALQNSLGGPFNL